MKARDLKRALEHFDDDAEVVIGLSDPINHCNSFAVVRHVCRNGSGDDQQCVLGDSLEPNWAGAEPIVTTPDRLLWASEADPE